MKSKFLTTIVAVVCALCCVFSFSACSEDEVPPTPTAHTHNYKWVDNGNGTHKQHCQNEGCDAPDINSGNHDFTNGNCVCGKEKPADSHTHVWSQTYEKNDTHHWYKCTVTGCTEKNGYAPHDFTNGNCVCGKEKPHSHDYKWVDNGDGTHKQHCANAGCDAPDINSGNHDFTNGDCVCGKEKSTEGLAYELNGDGESYCVTGPGTAQTAKLIIPEEYNGKPVTSVSAEAFKDCDFTSVVIPKSVVEIGKSAFEGCDSIEFMSLPFVGASKDGEPTSPIEYSLGYIFGAEKLEDNVQAVPSTLKSVEISDGSAINIGAFFCCANIENISIPDGVTTIGEWAFGACIKLKSIELPDGVEVIGESAFNSCSELTEIIIPDSITFVDEGAFAFCEALQYNEYDNALYLGNSGNPYLVMVAGKEKNPDIKTCDINENVKFIYRDAVSYLANLQTITLSDSNNAYSVYDGMLYNKAQTELIAAPRYITGDRVIPDGVTEIGADAFYNRKNLTGITIPNSVTKIAQRAFAGCDSLESISVPFVGIKVTFGGGMYFGYLFGSNESNRDVPQSLRTVIVTGDVSLGHGAFSSCPQLTTIKFLGKLSSFGNNAFANCGSLEIIFNGTKEEWERIPKGTGWNNSTDYTITCSDGEKITRQ